MTDKPIIFPGPMVRAILEGRKTMTRRVIRGPWRHRPRPEFFGGKGDWGDPECWGWEDEYGDCITMAELLPYRPGDQLWVRETWCPVDDDGDLWIDYRATPRWCASHPAGWHEAPSDPEALKWRSPIFMPRAASRITIEVTDVRIERLRDITAADAQASGLGCVSKDGSLFKYGVPDCDGLPGQDDEGWPWNKWEADPVMAFERLWNLKNPRRRNRWTVNPWVCVLDFRRIDI